jgi:tight adherence protein C
MLLIALLALALGGVAVAALVRAFTLSRSRVVAHLDELGAYGYAAATSGVAVEAADAGDAALARVAARLGDVVARRIGAMREAELRTLLVAAGLYSTSTRSLLGYRVLGIGILGALGMFIGHALIVHVVLVAFLGVCGWTLPLTYVRRRAATRAQAIEREVPNLIDQIVVTLEAGVGFSSSLHLSAERLTGPLGQEMRLALQEQRMGASLTDSLEHLRERVDSMNLRSFVRAVIQGERLGVSIGHVMRELATDMRKRRRQMAEEQAQKTPVKLLLPLVFLVLPTMFIVVLVPPVLELVHGLSR